MRKMTMMGAAAVGAVLLLALPAAAQQAAPQGQEHDAHHPAGDGAVAQAAPPAASQSPGPAVPGPAAGPMGGGQGMMGPGMGMMGGAGGMPGMMMRHHGAGGPPMNVTINVGPGVRVDAVEDGGERGGRPGMMVGGGMGQMMGMMPRMMAPPGGMTDGPGAMRPLRRIEGQLAYFRTELGITDAQAAQWDAFADAVRSAAEGLRRAHAQAMQAAGQPAPAPEQLERRAALLAAQLEATRAVASAAGRLYAALSDEQKRTADALMAEHLRDMRMAGL